MYLIFVFIDFKANFPELGKPKDVCKRWLDEMCNPESQYLPFKQPEYFDSIYLAHFDNSDYVSDWQDWDGVDYDKLFNIHRICILNKLNYIKSINFSTLARKQFSSYHKIHEINLSLF